MTAPSDPREPNTTGHEWDGLREFDNPLPRWWLWIFYGCIAFAIGYWVLMPAWPGINGYTRGTLGQSDRANVVRELAALKLQRAGMMNRLAGASLEQIEQDPELQSFALNVGQSVFGDNCATCHGQGGIGRPGYANLRDDVWLWGGSLQDILKTITVGVRSDHPDTRMSAMPAFGRDGILTAAQVNDLTEYVVALSRRPANAGAVSRAGQLFADNCVSCHGAQGLGNQQVGAPNLTDRDWLYGGEREAIRAQIQNGRGGVMPTWGARFDEPTLKALAVYIHANSGR